MVFCKNNGLSLTLEVTYLVKGEQCLSGDALKLTGGNCCLLYTLTCGLSREHEDVIAAGFSVLEHLYYLKSTPYYCGCARRNPQDKSPHSASVALTEIKLSHNCWPRWL